VVEPAPGSTAAYTYDALNDLTSVTQGAESRSFIYDSLSRLTSATNPESGTTSYTYDPDSNPITKTDARGITTTYAYDALNRVTGETYSDSTYPVTYTYDTSTGPSPMNTIGRLTDAKRTVQTVTVTERAIDQYDPMGRVLSERQCFVGGCAGRAYTLTHSYDVAGNVILSNNGMSNANAATLGYGYDGAGRLQAATSSLNDGEHPEVLFQATQYSAIGLTQASYALPSVSGTPAYSQTLSYDKRLRLTGETDAATNPTSGMPYSYAVSYDGAGNATAMNDSLMGAWSYTPDALNRLMTATPGTGAPGGYAGMYLCMNYDVYGNRTQSDWQTTACNPTSDPATARYDSANQVTWTTVNSAVNGFQYDASGDVTNDGANMYEYDAEGRQTGTLNSLSELTGYLYDGEGRRVMKVVVNGWNTQNPTTTIENEYLLGPNGEQVSVLDGSGNWQWTNVYAGGKQLATYNGSETYFALTDWLGSKRMELSVTGASTVTVGEQCTSLPFGDGLNCTGSDVNQLHFTGKERDAESGSDYFGARYLSSSMGRFMSPDPLGGKLANPQSLNRYVYALNNPLVNTDPTGMYVCEDSTNCDSRSDQNFAKSLAAAQTSVNNMAAGADRDAAQRAINSYGAMGVDNGVNVRFDSNVQGGVTEVSGVANGEKSADNPTGQNINVTFNPNSVGGTLDGGLVAHEGSHVADGSDWVKSGFSPGMDPTRYQTEIHAYQVQWNVTQATPGFNMMFGATIGSVPVIPGEPFKDARPDFQNLLKNNPQYGFTYKDTTSAFVKGSVVPR